MVIGVKAEKLDEYKKLHAAVWPGVLATISAANIRNYSIYLKEPENLLFGYWEYHGTDFAADGNTALQIRRARYGAVRPCGGGEDDRRRAEAVSRSAMRARRRRPTRTAVSPSAWRRTPTAP